MPTETLRPNADGDKTEWLVFGSSNHYANVDEETANNDTDYNWVASTTVGEKRDLYHIPDTAIPEGSEINKITLYFVHRGTAFTDARCAGLIKTNGTEYRGGYKTSGTTYVVSTEEWVNNPATGDPWTLDEINALQIGIAGTRGVWYDEETGFFYYDNTRCTQVYVVIDYTLVVVVARPLINKPLVNPILVNIPCIRLCDLDFLRHFSRLNRSSGGYNLPISLRRR